MSAENHTKILGFLAAALAREDHHLAVKIELVYTPANGFRQDPLRTWHRSQPNDSDYFTGPEGGGNQHVYTERFVAEILELAESHADSYGTGRHRFVLRVHQHLGGRETCAFAILPSFQGHADEDSSQALTSDGQVQGIGLPPTQAGQVAQLMRHVENKEKSLRDMMQTFLQSVGSMATQLREENTALREQLSAKDRERQQMLDQVEAARSQEHNRQIEAAVVTSKQERTDYAMKKIMGLLPVMVAHWAGGKNGGGKKEGAKPSPLALKVGELVASMRDEQKDQLQTILDLEQQIMLSSIAETVTDGGDSPVLGMIVKDFADSLRKEQMGAIMGALSREQQKLLVEAVQIAQVQNAKNDTKPPNHEAGASAGAPAGA